MADELNPSFRLVILCLQATEGVLQAVETKLHRTDKKGSMAITLNSWQPHDHSYYKLGRCCLEHISKCEGRGDAWCSIASTFTLTK